MTAEEKTLERIAELEATVAALIREFLKTAEETRERVAELKAENTALRAVIAALKGEG